MSDTGQSRAGQGNHRARRTRRTRRKRRARPGRAAPARAGPGRAGLGRAGPGRSRRTTRHTVRHEDDDRAASYTPLFYSKHAQHRTHPNGIANTHARTNTHTHRARQPTQHTHNNKTRHNSTAQPHKTQRSSTTPQHDTTQQHSTAPQHNATAQHHNTTQQRHKHSTTPQDRNTTAHATPQPPPAPRTPHVVQPRAQHPRPWAVAAIVHAAPRPIVLPAPRHRRPPALQPLMRSHVTRRLGGTPGTRRPRPPRRVCAAAHARQEDETRAGRPWHRPA